MFAAVVDRKKVWINREFDGIWDIPRLRPKGVRPHDWVKQQLRARFGSVVDKWTLIVAPVDGSMECSYPGLR